MAFKRPFVALSLLAASVLASPYTNSSPKGQSDCKSNEFWYSQKGCCLPHGGPPSPPPPPPKKQCPPTNWYWHPENACCVPVHPPPKNPPPPQCRSGWEWNHGTQCCEPHSGTPTTTTKPSPTPPAKGGHYPLPPAKTPTYPPGKNSPPPKSPPTYPPGKNSPPPKSPPTYPPGKNSSPGGGSPQYPPSKGQQSSPGKNDGYKKRSGVALCPQSLEACPIGGLTASEYECLDTTAELQSCGGCLSTGKGQDCTAIKGAWNVGCEAGSCAVYTCALGYKVSADGKSCIEN